MAARLVDKAEPDKCDIGVVSGMLKDALTEAAIHSEPMSPRLSPLARLMGEAEQGGSVLAVTRIGR